MGEMLRNILIALVAMLLWGTPVRAEDGYDLWLRYRPLDAGVQQQYAAQIKGLMVEGDSATMAAARSELQRGLSGLLGRLVAAQRELTDGTILVGTPKSSPSIASLKLPLGQLGREGFVIRTMHVGDTKHLVVAANEDIGALYGSFALLRRLQANQPIEQMDISDQPKLDLRLLNHWDNLDRTVERGYAGSSIWDWHKLPAWKDPRYVDYARANASIGINGVVLTNVNASAEVLTPRYLEKVAALADMFRPWGIRVYLTARFSAPIEIGALKTADPLQQDVRRWWKQKAAEIYRLVPDFGGFLVKANSEGQPGPQDYGRSHADGANLLADAVAPHGGKVLWRAFVYSPTAMDRAKQAYDEFKPLDGQFRDNVILQVKNGPIDFQPREPFHPLFGQMPRTAEAMEVQITKEYLGFATHLAYLGTMWEEVLQADTCSPKCGRPVSSTIRAMAGVANIGTDRNWSGSHFDQANWYAFGRLAWDPDLKSASIAEEWARMTWSNDPAAVQSIVGLMMRSHEAVVDYMTPLGLHHLMATDHHYGPGLWVDDLTRPDWNPTYYHRAGRGGIGFDRTSSGSNAVAQYAPNVGAIFADSQRIPERYLLWFHHLPWSYRMRSGRPLWAELLMRYDRGVNSVHAMRSQWSALAGKVDGERHHQVDRFLSIQEEEAKWWRDASIAYFCQVLRLPLPSGVKPPEHDLEYYKSLRFPHAPGIH